MAAFKIQGSPIAKHELALEFETPGGIWNESAIDLQLQLRFFKNNLSRIETNLSDAKFAIAYVHEGTSSFL